MEIRLGPSYSIQIGVGLIAGILGGLSSIWSPPVATYMIARGLEKERFIAGHRFCFLGGGRTALIGALFGRRSDKRDPPAIAFGAFIRDGRLSDWGNIAG